MMPATYHPNLMEDKMIRWSTAIAAVALLASTASAQLMGPEKVGRYWDGLPNIEDAAVEEILGGETHKLIWYTKAEIPPTYPHEGTWHDPRYNIAAIKQPGVTNGNAAADFPWARPFGTHGISRQNVEGFNLLALPRGKGDGQEGLFWPVVWFTKPLPSGFNTVRWRFPVDTVAMEFLMQRNPTSGAWRVFSIRTRRKLDDGTWEPDVLRPFHNSQELAQAIDKERPGKQLEIAVSEMRTSSDTHTVKAFRRHAPQEYLGDLKDHALVDTLLRYPFRSINEQAWSGEGKNRVFAATTTADYHIVPAGFTAGFVEVTRESCMSCHRDTGATARGFQDNKEWYGSVKGSDGILSFHPIAHGSISPNGVRRGVNINQRMLDSGVVSRYDPTHHPDSHYPATVVLTMADNPDP